MHKGARNNSTILFGIYSKFIYLCETKNNLVLFLPLDFESYIYIITCVYKIKLVDILQRYRKNLCILILLEFAGIYSVPELAVPGES